MNRLPFVATVAAVVALTASVAYWGLQLYKPAQRPIAAVPVLDTPPALIDAARGLFGGETAVAAASTYQLRGVVAAGNGRRSVAIIAANNEAPKAYPVGAELAPGVVVKEVQARSVTLSEGGVQKRLDLPADTGVSMTTAAPLPDVARGTAPPQAQPITPPQPAPSATPPPGTPVGQPGQLAPVQSAPAQRTSTGQ
ncbi:type II secretion system protein N [[Empedobacter] haloabium]|uniref:Type II secretion system protein N n=1 Tax=[Empedobacter] haloabium TaxID=592317 RepID=A0ABZ1UJM9_9BURK